MHEASVALDLIRVAETVALENGGGRVLSLTVRIGQWSAIVPAALRAAFPTCAEGTLLAGARLSIQAVPGLAECPQHGRVELNLQRGLRCPVCDTSTPELLQGDELELDSLELE